MLTVERDERAGVVTFTVDEPTSRNALGLATMTELTARIREAAADEALRAAIVTGGGSVFVSGGDLRELKDRTSPEDAAELTDLGHALTTAIAELPFPVLAALPGPAIGGGAELAVACDLRIAAENARIGFKQARMGVTTAWGTIPRLVALVGQSTAARLLYTGVEVGASEAKRLGLVDDVVPDGEALATARAWAADVALASPTAIAALKKLLAAVHAPDARARERQAFVETWCGPDHLEAVEAWFARRPPAFRPRGQ
jgi:enoyl-CoA hydratase